MKIASIFNIIAITLLLSSCASSNESGNKSVQTTIALVNQVECAIQISQADCNRMIHEFSSRIAEEKSTEAPVEIIQKLERIQDELLFVADLSQDARNWNIQLASELIMSTVNADSVSKFNSSNLNSAYSFEDGVGEVERFQLVSLMHLTNPLVSHDISKKQSDQLIENFKTYRNKLLTLICDYSDYSGGQIVNRKIDLDGLELYSNKLSDQGLFDQQIRKALKNVNKKDQEVVKSIIRMLTLPDHKEIDGNLIKWSEAKFIETPLIYSCAELLCLNSLISKSEKLAMELIASLSIPHHVGFSKIFVEFVPQKYSIKAADIMTLKQRLYLEDPIEEIPLRYWIDDSTKQGDPYNTYLYNSSGKLDLPILKPGGHIIYGDYQAQEYGSYAWKPWKTEFYIE